MNVGMQRRIGKLPKTPELDYHSGSSYYGGTHAGWNVGKGNRKSPPTTISNGMFGIGSIYGDGKLHYYGDDEGQANLPPEGIYGTTLGHYGMDAQVAAIAIPGSGSASYQVATEDHLFGDGTTSESFVTTQTALAIVGILGIAYMMRN